MTRLVRVSTIGAAAVAAAVLAGCPPPKAGPPDAVPTPPVDHINLTTEFPTYAPGAEATIRLANPSSREYGYNLCVSRFERLVGEDWVQVQPMLAEACTMELRLIGPGGTDSFTFRLRPDVPAGQYRVVTAIEEMDTGTRLDLPSNTFAVTPRG